MLKTLLRSLTALALVTTLTSGLYIISFPQKANAATYTATVNYVVDGDTINLTNDVLGTRSVRLLSIDTPETNYNGESQGHHATDASNYLKQLLPSGTKITLETDVTEKDSYGRLLAHVFKGTQDINKEMLLKGHAVTYYIWANMKYFNDYRTAMQQARQAGLGIWNPNDPLTELPFEFRMRVSNRTPDKYVGHFDTKQYVDPADYPTVPVEHRVFFFTEQDAISAGYTRSGGTTPTPASGLFINELLPNASTEWIEIHNASNSDINIGGYIIDDLRTGGSAAYTIPAGTIIKAKGYFVWNTSTYFNNTGDDANLIAPDGTVVDTYKYTTTSSNKSFYRFPDGGAWSATMDSTPTKGASNQ